ncbi:hypothetical protein GOV12_07025 [Candidatus Pacearchaeota archaeon]|nr:hypothetical protein [Candidatus Pacearchaeota archaeon]
MENADKKYSDELIIIKLHFKKELQKYCKDKRKSMTQYIRDVMEERLDEDIEKYNNKQKLKVVSE